MGPLREARREPLIVEVGTTEPDVEATEEWPARFQGRGLSLKDGVSFAVRARRGPTEALTLD